ncbi:hypothetical protein AVEN_205890-1 [Araneus ventricosus]|uniref:ATP-dependent DNA helicase n=1 Tax=Araneus ventricosus TaxID=182803 RepID=A0A4Y2NRK9_ARAVE|nr:hypothetical protein AVEN_205890-1 [Araneus ventricosus]
MWELDCDDEELHQRLNKFIPRWNPERKAVLDDVLQQIESGCGSLFFLDAPDGNEKTFLINLFSFEFGKKKIIAMAEKTTIALACSGISTTLLDGGRTEHSVLRESLNLAHEGTTVCNFNKITELYRMLQN